MGAADFHLSTLVIRMFSKSDNAIEIHRQADPFQIFRIKFDAGFF
jgi:hypothetical protein